MKDKKENTLTTDETHELTACVFEHYMKHHEIVLKKIQHARTATRQSLKEYDANQEDAEDRIEISDIKKYDQFWNELIKLFKEAGISSEGLMKIEDVLLRVPKIIKKYYDILISKDRPLLLLIKEIKSKKYKQAIETIKNLQTPSNELSFNDLNNYMAQDNRPEYILGKAAKLPHS